MSEIYVYGDGAKFWGDKSEAVRIKRASWAETYKIGGRQRPHGGHSSFLCVHSSRNSSMTSDFRQCGCADTDSLVENTEFIASSRRTLTKQMMKLNAKSSGHCFISRNVHTCCGYETRLALLRCLRIKWRWRYLAFKRQKKLGSGRKLHNSHLQDL
jgi:hypothetical protein